jgi:hypothetical protein
VVTVGALISLLVPNIPAEEEPPVQDWWAGTDEPEAEHDTEPAPA